MKRDILDLFGIMALVSCALLAQQKPSPDSNVIAMIPEPESRFTIGTTGNVLFAGEDTKGAWTFKVFRDGRMETTGTYKADDAAQKFWRAMAGKYICAEQKQEREKNSK